MFVIDVKRSYAATTLQLTSAGEALAAVAPAQWAAAQNFVERHVHLASAAIAEISRWPVWLCLAFCGVLAAWLGKRPPPEFGFSSR